jgi:antitoxin ParD1/3/4
MEDLNISLPSSQQAYAEDQVASGQYPSVSDYVSELIRADQKAKAEEKLEALLLEGLDSGPGRKWTEDDWERLRKRAEEG